MISVFGSSGFIGSRFCELYPDTIKIPREQRASNSPLILNFISTVTNYEVFTNPYLDINTNLVLLIEMLEENRKLFGSEFEFVQISTWFTYGKTDKLPAREIDLCNPTGFYSITSLAREQLLASYCNTYGIKFKILRMANVLGIGDKKMSAKKNATQFFVRKIVKGEPIEIYSTRSKRDFIHVDDACNAISLILSKGEQNSIYNIGNGTPYCVPTLWKWVMEKTGYDMSKMSYISSPFHDIVQTMDMWLDVTRLSNLGFKPQYDIWAILDELIGHYQHE